MGQIIQIDVRTEVVAFFISCAGVSLEENIMSLPRKPQASLISSSV